MFSCAPPPPVLPIVPEAVTLCVCAIVWLCELPAPLVNAAELAVFPEAAPDVTAVPIKVGCVSPVFAAELAPLATEVPENEYEPPLIVPAGIKV